MKISKEKPSAHKDVSHPTIFHEILNSNLPHEEKSIKRMSEQAQVIVGAGQEMVAWSISVIAYHLPSSPLLLRKLKEELATAIPDPKFATPEAHSSKPSLSHGRDQGRTSAQLWCQHPTYADPL